MTINQCARCGQTHEGIKPKKFKMHSVIDCDDKTTWTQWFTCPKTGDPVLLRTSGRKLNAKMYQS